MAPADTEEAKAAYNWLINMTNVEEFTDDWASKTYEPTIGVESKNDANTRVVVVANIDYARMNFSSISGIDPDMLSSTQSQTIDGVGTITWTPSAKGANNLATVDVNTKLIPHLSRIVYCTTDQVGANGSDFEGTAYFRFGDVIEDSEGYYWVCVKPAFGTGSAPQQQGVWINVINRDPENGKGLDGRVPPIPDNNICSDYNEKYNGNTILLPTKLKSTKEMTHNLANLVWALLDPESYEENIDDGIGLGGYDYQYNGKKFCQARGSAVDGEPYLGEAVQPHLRPDEAIQEAQLLLLGATILAPKIHLAQFEPRLPRSWVPRSMSQIRTRQQSGSDKLKY